MLVCKGCGQVYEDEGSKRACEIACGLIHFAQLLRKAAVRIARRKLDLASPEAKQIAKDHGMIRLPF